MAKLAAVPDGVLFVREGYRVNPPQIGFDGEVFSGLEPCPLHGYAFQSINQFDLPFVLRRYPINAIDAFGELSGERTIVIFPDVLFTLGMAPVALFSPSVIGAGGEERLPVELSLPIVAGTTMKPLVVCPGFDSGSVGLHGEANIHMAKPTGEFGTM
ncbi:MAG TPA: hypothetical protein VEI54_05225 [Candidatus Limnocylindrales bacterium]|nr:hypothetical protein [Candidatus Limnocylindrales bacterium]